DSAIDAHRAASIALALFDFQISSRVRNGDGVRHGGSQHRVPAMTELAGQGQFGKPLNGRGHRYEALAELLERYLRAGLIELWFQVFDPVAVEADRHDFEFLREGGHLRCYMIISNRCRVDFDHMARCNPFLEPGRLGFGSLCQLAARSPKERENIEVA